MISPTDRRGYINSERKFRYFCDPRQNAPGETTRLEGMVPRKKVIAQPQRIKARHTCPENVICGQVITQIVIKAQTDLEQIKPNLEDREKFHCIK